MLILDFVITGWPESCCRLDSNEDEPDLTACYDEPATNAVNKIVS